MAAATTTLSTTTATWADALGLPVEDTAAEIRMAVAEARLVVTRASEEYAECRTHEGNGDLIATIQPVSGRWCAARGYLRVYRDTYDDAVRACLDGQLGW